MSYTIFRVCPLFLALHGVDFKLGILQIIARRRVAFKSLFHASFYHAAYGNNRFWYILQRALSWGSPSRRCA